MSPQGAVAGNRPRRESAGAKCAWLARLFDVASWHLASKLSVTFCGVVLVVTAIITAFAMKDVRDRDEVDEKETLQDLAAATAGRLDQFIMDTEAAVETFATDDEVESIMGWDAERRKRAEQALEDNIQPDSDDVRIAHSVRDAVHEFYERVTDDVRTFVRERGANTAIALDELISVNVYTLQGEIVASSRSGGNRTTPKDRRSRATFRRPVEELPGKVYMSSMHRGQSHPDNLYVSFTRAVLAPTTGKPIGLASFAIDQAVFGYMIRDLAQTSLQPQVNRAPGGNASQPNAITSCTPYGQRPGQREVFLVDRHGAVLMPRCPGDAAFHVLDQSALEEAREDGRYDRPFDWGDKIASHHAKDLMDVLTGALKAEDNLSMDSGDSALTLKPLWHNDEERDRMFTATVGWEERRSRLAALHPVRQAREHGWHVVYTEDHDDWFAPLQRDIWRVFLQMFTGIGIVGSALLIGFVHVITRQTRELHKGTVALAAGALETRIPVLSRDELGALAKSFNDMAAQLSAAIDKAESERRRADEARAAAEVANRAKSTFLTNMSHELRTPLNAIIGYGEMLAENASAAGREEEFGDLQNIVSSGRHLLDLVNELMDLAKIEAGKMDVHIENVEVPRLVAEVLALTQPLVEKNGNKLASSIDPNAVVVRADAKRLRQGLLNLISNAAKFTQHGIVRLDVKHAGESITFDVSDTGIGMTPAQMARLFQPFMQAEDTTSRKYGGTGLGLTNTKHFCELMGGSVSLESKPGVGSTFTIRLPATSRAPSSGRPAEARGHASEERPVLVIDDDPAVVELISSTLKEEGFRVVSALNGEEGLKLARQVEPLAITLDVVNSGSGMDGFQTLEALRADPATRSIPVIVFTMVESRERALSFGAAESLSKPVHPDQLMAVFRRLGIVSRAYPVLIVEDDTVNRGLLRKMLERTGFRVEEAENGRIALDLLESEQPAVVLLDLMLPEVDGFELLARIRERRDLRDVPVVVITGRDLTDGDRERFSDNVRDVLQKGKYSREELVAHVRELISEQAAARSRARTAASIEPAT